MSSSRHEALLISYSLVPSRNSRRVTVMSANPAYCGGTRRPSFWKVIDTSAMPVGGRDSLPLKITSSIERPRRCFALCSPIAQRMASTTFDLPQPLGPTTPVTPSSKEKTTRSANDLKPEISRRRIFICRGKIHESWVAYKACQAAKKMGCVRGAQAALSWPGKLARPSDIGLRRTGTREVEAVPIAEAQLPRSPLAAVVHSDSRPPEAPRLRRALRACGDEQPRAPVAQIIPVHREPDPERFAEIPRTRRGVEQRQVSGEGLRGAEEHRVGVASRAADRVQHRVHAIDQVHVGVPRLPVHHLCASGAAGPGMAGEIVLADVGLGLDDAADAHLAS